jgi:hypothetical protein
MASKSHPQVDFSVDDCGGNERIFKTFDEAAVFAVAIAASRGESSIDVFIYSESGARWYGGDDAVEQYREDPDASVSDRIEIKVNVVGRIA